MKKIKNFIAQLNLLPIVIKYKCLVCLCKYDIHIKKIFSHRFKNLYSTYEVHICRICLKQIIKKIK
jgi:hypothetical protein